MGDGDVQDRALRRLLGGGGYAEVEGWEDLLDLLNVAGASGVSAKAPI